MPIPCLNVLNKKKEEGKRSEIMRKFEGKSEVEKRECEKSTGRPVISCVGRPG